MTELLLKTLSGEDTILEASDLDQFQKYFRGSLITKDENCYDEVRSIWNGMIDKRPGLIASCTGSADVIAAVFKDRKLRGMFLESAASKLV